MSRLELERMRPVRLLPTFEDSSSERPDVLPSRPALSEDGLLTGGRFGSLRSGSDLAAQHPEAGMTQSRDARTGTLLVWPARFGSSTQARSTT